MNPNYFIFNWTQMMAYVQMDRELGGDVKWADVLELENCPPISLIQVVDDNDDRKILAFVGLTWEHEGMELVVGNIKVEEGWNHQGVGPVIIRMVIAIGRFFKTQRITGTVVGESSNWDWYKKLGFQIHDCNKLLMEFDTNN